MRLVLSGHEHNFQHSRADGIDYFVTGGGGKVRAARPDGTGARRGTVAWAAAVPLPARADRRREARVTPIGEDGRPLAAGRSGRRHRGVHDDHPSLEDDPMELIRYSAAACQTDLPNPIERRQMRANTDRMLSMIDSAVAGSAPFLPVRLVVFPEFAHAAPVFATAAELLEKLAVPIPNEHTDRFAAKARSTASTSRPARCWSRTRRSPAWSSTRPASSARRASSTKYRKVNPWIPYEVHASPHDLPGYEEPLFPVADTPIGRIGAARSATTGSSRRPCASSRPTAPRC